MKRTLLIGCWFSLLMIPDLIPASANPPVAPPQISTGFPPSSVPGFRPNYRRYPYGPFYGYYPSVYNGFYANGLPLNGPPVPTYAPIPGVFGGADPLYGNSPFTRFGFGLGYLGSRSPSPRPVPNVSIYSQGGDVPVPPILRDASIPETCILLEVRCPSESAVLVVDGKPTQQTGTVRKFQSPPLTVGSNYSYDVRLEWQAEGKTVSKALTVVGRPGETVLADFTSLR